MTENWDQDLNVMLNITQWDDFTSKLIKNFHKLNEDAIEFFIAKKDDKFVKDEIKKHLKNIHRDIYHITLVESWMGPELIDSMVRNFHFTVNSKIIGFFSIEENEKGKILKNIKKKTFMNLNELYITKILTQISLKD